MDKKLEQELQNSDLKYLKDNMLRVRREILMTLQDGVYLFGSARLASFAIEQCKINRVKIVGVLDNELSKQGRQKEQFPIINPKLAETGYPVIICSFWWNEIKQQLNSLGFTKILHYEELAAVDSRFQVYGMSFRDLQKDLIDNKSKYLALGELFDDDKSKEIYDLLIQYRMTMDSIFLNRAYQKSIVDGKIYFDKNLMNRNNFTSVGIFVDAGGNLGETTEDFIEWISNKYEKVLFFEPDECLAEQAGKRLKQYKGIQVFNAGLGNEHCILNYDSVGGEQVSSMRTEKKR